MLHDLGWGLSSPFIHFFLSLRHTHLSATYDHIGTRKQMLCWASEVEMLVCNELLYVLVLVEEKRRTQLRDLDSTYILALLYLILCY